jgi:hypothetical protein
VAFNFDLKLPPQVEKPERFYKTVFFAVFIFFHVKENEAKENAVSRLTLRVPSAVGRAETRPAFAKAAAGLRQSPRLYRPQTGCSARDKGKHKN